MKKTEIIDSGKTPDGSDIYLQVHDDNTYFIMVDGMQLMSTRRCYSEERLSEIVCEPYRGQDVRVLIGGLGFGYTLQAALSCVSENSEVVVAELIPCVIEWNKNKSYPLAHAALEDPRVRLLNQDVMQVLRDHKNYFNGIMMDVDNGPEAFTDGSNGQLYNRDGIATLRAALRPKGTLGVWSATANQQFEKALSKSGFKNVKAHTERSRPGGKGSVHTIFLGTKQ